MGFEPMTFQPTVWSYNCYAGDSLTVTVILKTATHFLFCFCMTLCLTGMDPSTAPPLSHCYHEISQAAYEPAWPSGKALGW